MKFRVEGADMGTGQEVAYLIDASNMRDAESQAAGLNVMISDIRFDKQAEIEAMPRPQYESPPSPSRSGTQYDPRILQRHANSLYFQAGLAIFMSILIGAAPGATVALLTPMDERAMKGAMILMGSGAIIGLLVGLWIAFWFQLRAQMVLCQMKIEQHLQKIAREIK